MGEHRVTVYRTNDPIQADMLGALLRENGIAACVIGTRHGAAIGVGQHILELHIEVPRAQAGPATDFLEAFFEGDGAALLAEHAGFAPEDDDESGDADDQAEREDAGEAARVGGRGHGGEDRDLAGSASRRRGPGAWVLAIAVAALVAGVVMIAVAALLGALREPAPGSPRHGGEPALLPAAQPAH